MFVFESVKKKKVRSAGVLSLPVDFTIPPAVFPIFRWRQIDSLLHIPAEIRHGREIHPFRDFRQRKFLPPEQTGDFLHGEAFNPVRGRLSAYPLTYFRQIVGRDAEARSVRFKVSVPDVFTVVQQFYEIPQQGGDALRHLQVLVTACVNVVQVKNMRGQQTAQ